MDIKEKFGKLIPYKKKEGQAKVTKAKRIKMTARDIEDNCIRIREAMKQVAVGTPEYDVLSKELEHETVVLRKYKDAKFWIQPKDVLIIGGTAVAFIFSIALNREHPAALKTAGIILKMFPYKGL